MGRGTRDNGTDANQAHLICNSARQVRAAWHAKVCKSEACLWFHTDMVFPSDFPHFFNHQLVTLLRCCARVKNKNIATQHRYSWCRYHLFACCRRYRGGELSCRIVVLVTDTLKNPSNLPQNRFSPLGWIVVPPEPRNALRRALKREIKIQEF